MTTTTMLTRRRFLSSGVAIGGGLSTRPLASALLISYSHQVWDASNTQRLLPLDDDYRPTESFFAIRDCFDKRNQGKL